jgi:ABC-2 type transport system ATP-binding protein
MSRPAVQIVALSKSYDAVVALDSVSLEIVEGDMACIVGPDGAGKTTLIKLLCGILEPSSGSIKILGLDTVRDFTVLKKRIGYLSQTFTLYGDLSIDENMEFFAEINRVKDYKKRRDELLQFTRLKEFRKRLAEKLSGGMKQKLALACTLIHSPDVLFLDEPTTGVDPVSRREFWIILADLFKKGITIVMATPYMDEAERASLVGLLHRGRLLFSGSPERIKALYPETIIEVVTNDVRRAGQALVRHKRVARFELFGDRIHIPAGKDRVSSADVKQVLVKAGVKVESIRSVAPSLENVFISLIKKEELIKKKEKTAL